MDASGQGNRRQKPIFHELDLAVSAPGDEIRRPCESGWLPSPWLPTPGKSNNVTICPACAIVSHGGRLDGAFVPSRTGRIVMAAWGHISGPALQTLVHRLRLCHLALMPDLPDLGPWQRHPSICIQPPIGALQPLNRRRGRGSGQRRGLAARDRLSKLHGLLRRSSRCSREPPCLTHFSAVKPCRTAPDRCGECGPRDRLRRTDARCCLDMDIGGLFTFHCALRCSDPDQASNGSPARSDLDSQIGGSNRNRTYISSSQLQAILSASRRIVILGPRFVWFIFNLVSAVLPPLFL